MKVVHCLEKFNQKVEREEKDISFLMTNKKKGFAWINPNEVSSRYQGVFFTEYEKMFRVIESLNPFKKTEEIKNNFHEIELSSTGEKEKIFIPDFLNGIVFEGKDCDIFLDFKESYENDYCHYNIEKKENEIIVKMSYRNKDYYLVICFNGEFNEEKKFIHRIYDYDKNRNSFPNERDVLFLGKIKSEKIVFYFSSDKEDALNKSKDLYNNLKDYKNRKKERVEKIFRKISGEKVNMAYNSCRLMLDNLNDEEGLFAGLPWFFQYWARDELISLKGLNFINEKNSEEIIKKWIPCIKKNLTEFPAKLKIDKSEEGISIDSAGWLLKRLELFPELIQENKKILDNFFSGIDEEIVNEKRNTWMDSIERDAGIEIQAMKLFALNLASRFTNKKEEFIKKENLLKNKIKELYWNGETLFDSLDKKIRPNIFIAYYFYPQLLEQKEWEVCFDNLIKELWCDWGGFSTISKNDSLFQKNYTGETGGSYHNGDSWFWINSLGGLCLFDLNKEKYYEYIKDILNASTEEILFSGAIANHSEVSSSSSLKSEGCVCQAWSSAMYVEFIKKLIGN